MKLVLESLTIKNFKSYKGEHFINNIDKSFTAIVGPNGSGKSNIIDSILFVLGFRAKKMRHTQLTDLIYNDGKKESSCFVKLTFNKFTIKREININKTSKYFLNDKEISNNDLIKKMMKEGIDMEHNRFLILQGEIESIAMLKPKEGLLEFLEDIIETSKYKIEIDKLIEETKNMEENNLTIQNNLKFIKTEFDHINELKKQNEEILIHKLKTNEYLKELKNLNLEKLKRNLHKQEEKEKEVKNQIEKLKDLNIENNELLKTLENEHKKIEKLLKNKEEIYLNFKREYKIKERNNIMQKDLKNKLEKQIKNLKNDFNSIKAKIEMKNKENEIFNKELKDNENELKILIKNREELKSKQNEEHEKINKKYFKDFEKLKNQEDKLTELIQTKSKENQKNLKYKLEINKYKEEEKILKDDIKNIETTLQNFINENNYDKEYISKDKLKEELRELEKDIQKTQQEIQKRKTRYNEVYQREENNKKEKELLNNFKNIKGVIGRLSDIGEVDEKYNLALKISCSRLNNIVVDTTQTAEKCIEIIKKENLQRSTFIILEKIQEIPKLEKFDLPYMFDLVKCDKKYKKCFYFSLTDTLLAEDLNKAQSYAFNKSRKRVVTLDGKLIEKSGIMTGGKYHEKIKNFKDVEKALEKMLNIKNTKLSNLKKIEDYENIKILKIKLKDKNEELKNLIFNLKNLSDNFKEFNYDEEIQNIKNEISNFKKIINKNYDTSLQGNLQICNEKIELLENRNQEIKIFLSEEIESISNKEKELEDKIYEFNEIRILDISELKNKMIVEEKSFQEINEDFKNIQENLNKLKIQMGDEYHIEIDLKNQYEDIEEEMNKIKKEMNEEKEQLRIIKEEICHHTKYLHKDEKYVNFEDKVEIDANEETKSNEINKSNEETKSNEINKIENNMTNEINKIENNMTNETNKIENKSNETNKIENSDDHCRFDSLKMEDIEDFLRKIKKKLKRLNEERNNKEVDFLIFDEFKKTKSSYDKVASEFNLQMSKYETKKKQVDEIKKTRFDEFMSGLNKINFFLKEIYKKLTYGGNAELELIDYLDPFSDGIRLAVMPPKKCWKSVSNLSGGEKTLSSLSLIFALHKFKPSPFYVMDEIDAALDFRNVSIISQYIKEMSKSSQFVVISLRNDMFEISKTVLGVYKVNNVSKFLMINVEEMRNKILINV
ncbi:structural maintenance of chromosomes protein 4 (SMC4) [Vairimorpha necatrix]|uniref:Structural maintenance of chromosomes protein n=1 Tax=Vairimorpha necatrix TaxID=6039 RepID=A0AAX4JAU8_9MICR